MSWNVGHVWHDRTHTWRYSRDREQGEVATSLIAGSIMAECTNSQFHDDEPTLYDSGTRGDIWRCKQTGKILCYYCGLTPDCDSHLRAPCGHVFCRWCVIDKHHLSTFKCPHDNCGYVGLQKVTNFDHKKYTYDAEHNRVRVIESKEDLDNYCSKYGGELLPLFPGEEVDVYYACGMWSYGSKVFNGECGWFPSEAIGVSVLKQTIHDSYHQFYNSFDDSELKTESFRDTREFRYIMNDLEYIDPTEPSCDVYYMSDPFECFFDYV